MLRATRNRPEGAGDFRAPVRHWVCGGIGSGALDCALSGWLGSTPLQKGPGTPLEPSSHSLCSNGV